MAVTQERFNEGLTYQQYMDQITQNKDRFVENYEQGATQAGGCRGIQESAGAGQRARDRRGLVRRCGRGLARARQVGRSGRHTQCPRLPARPERRPDEPVPQRGSVQVHPGRRLLRSEDARARPLHRAARRPDGRKRRRAQAFFAAHPEYNAPENADFGQLTPEARQAWGAESTKLRAERASAWNQMLVDEFKKLVSGVPA